METIYRITAPHFVAGVIIDEKEDNVTRAAPIVRYMMGWSDVRVKAHCQKKVWKIEAVAMLADGMLGIREG